MKKHRKYSVDFFICLFTVIVFFFAGCKSLPEEEVINPVTILSANNNYYCSISSTFDNDLIKHAANVITSNLSDRDIELLQNYIDRIYIGYQKSGLENCEIVVTGNIPVPYLESQLKKNPNFIKGEIKDSSLKNKYNYYTFAEYQICIISKKYILISSDVKTLIKNYERIIYSTPDETNVDSVRHNPLLIELFSDETKNCKFYVNSDTLLQDLLKLTSLKFNIEVPDLIFFEELFLCEDDPESYITNLSIYLGDEKIAKAFRTMFNFLFAQIGENNAKIEVNGKNILINDYKIKKSVLYKYLNIN